MSAERIAAVERLHRAIGELAGVGGEGAVLVLEAEPSSLERFAAHANREHVGDVLTAASERAARSLAPSQWARTGWNRHEFLLLGPRDVLVAAARALLEELLADDAFGGMEWRAILTRVFPGDPRRTHFCDPGYDLALVKYSAVVWVEPYRGDDWQASQRDPTTTVLWRRSPGTHRPL